MKRKVLRVLLKKKEARGSSRKGEAMKRSGFKNLAWLREMHCEKTAEDP